MKWYYNFNIHKKLLFGFGTIIFLYLLVTCLGIYSLKSLDSRYTDLENGAYKRIEKLLQTNTDFVRVRLNMATTALMAVLEKDENVKTYYDNFNTYLKAASQDLADIHDALETDDTITPAQKEQLKSAIATIQSEIDTQYYQSASELYTASTTKAENQAENIGTTLNTAAGIGNEINKKIDELVDIASADTQNKSDIVTQFSYQLITGQLIFSLVIVLVSIIISFVIAKIIRTPIIALTDASTKIAAGNLNIKIGSNYRDEIGNLTNRMADIVNIFNLIITETKKTSEELDAGDIEARMNEDKFNGDYKIIAISFNKTLGDIVSDMLLTIHTIESYAEGDFTPKMKRYPGKKAILCEMVDLLQNNFIFINKDMNDMISQVKHGHLDVAIDASLYQGAWNVMAENLNQLVHHIDAPVNEVSTVLNHVSQGFFDKQIQGTYEGKFKTLKDSVNKTISNTALYINDVSSVLTQMAQKDLNITMDKNYIGQFKTIQNALENIITTFNDLIQDFGGSAEQVSEGARLISESSISLANGVTDQASAVGKLNETMSSILKNTKDNTENSLKANQLTKDTKEDGMTDKNKMESMLVAMNEIEEASLNISKIIKAIDDIAFQTNLLALNAAVEAARAGVHGKGFAVVAEEVRNLAIRSQNAAVETTGLINKTVELVSNGTKIANSTASSLNSMIQRISEIADIIDTVSVASEHQGQDLDRVNELIGRIYAVTQKNTATSQETAASSEELSSQAEVFKTSVKSFVLKR